MEQQGDATPDAGNGRESIWSGFTEARAIEWTRVLRRHWPDWPGFEQLRRISVELGDGRPAALTAWALRAREAEAIGFSPDLYDRLHLALDAVPPFRHPSHPDNEPDPRWPEHVIRAFDTAAWRDWPWLVGSGWTDGEAARLLLAAQDLPEPGA